MLKKCCAAFLCICLLAASLPVRASTPDLGITAEAYILVEATTGRVLQSKNEQKHLPVASTTKIMTALLTLEQPGLDEYFTVDSNAIRVEGSSMGLREGDQASLACLAAGMLLSSGNDAANAAAVRIDGSIEAFAERMNQRASELGMVDSHFVTPSGLHDENHYSTAADMALLARYALQNDRFAELCRQSSCKLSFGNPPFDRWLKNHNRLLKEYQGCIGVKTGFTKKAGRCLVSAAQRNGVTLVCVTLNAPNDWRDHSRLFDYGFSVVQTREFTPDVSDLRWKIVGSQTKTVGVKPLSALTVSLTEEEEARLTREVYLPPFAYAPVKAGEVAGEARYYCDGFLVGSIPLLAAEDADYFEPPPKQNIFDHIKAFFREHFR